MQLNKRCKKFIRFIRFDEDYYKLIKTNNALNSNYIEYESKGVKNKT